MLTCLTVQNYTAGIAQIFYNPPKGLLNSTTAIPKGIFDTLIGISEGFGNLPRSYGEPDRRSLRGMIGCRADTGDS
jgi:sterol 3beta-glucosyltransferase